MLNNCHKDYSWLRKFSTESLCCWYFAINTLEQKKRKQIIEDRRIQEAIRFIVGDKELQKYLVVELDKVVSAKDFELWYSESPRSLTIAEIRAMQLS